MKTNIIQATAIPASGTAERDETIVTYTTLGWSHIHWGLSLFFTGFVTGYVPLVHYVKGAVAGDVGPLFLKNMTLWWGCPGVLAEMTLKSGGVGMIAIGLCYLALARQSGSSTISRMEQIAPKLCAYGLVAELVTAAVGYVVCNIFWPNFYFEPIQAGKNVWLSIQIVSISIFVVGLYYAYSGIKRASRQQA